MLKTIKCLFLKDIRLHLLIIHHFRHVFIICILILHLLSNAWKSTIFFIFDLLTSRFYITSIHFFHFRFISSNFFSLIQIYRVIWNWRISLSNGIVQLKTRLHQRGYMHWRKSMIVIRINIWFLLFVWCVILINLKHHFISTFIFIIISLIALCYQNIIILILIWYSQLIT